VNATIDLQTFLKAYGTLARDQYERRALMRKVHDVQRAQRARR